MANCERCTAILKKQWKFCPECGKKIGMPMQELFQEIHEHFKEIDKLFGQDHTYDPSGVSIRVDKSAGRPSIELDLFGNAAPKLKKKLNIPVSMLLQKENVEEPTATVRRMAQHIVYTIKLPGISAKKDVNIANYRVNRDQLVIKFKPLVQ